MKLELLSIAMALTGALAYMQHGGGGFGGGWGGGLVVSRRDAEAAAAETPTVVDLSAVVQTLLDSAKEGMTLDAMGAAAVSIQLSADKIVDAQGGEASDVQKAIDDAAFSFSGVVAVSSLFDEPLTYEASKMDAALCLLNTLDTKAKEQDAAGESTQATVAAISMTAQAMQDIMADTVGIIAFKYNLGAGKKDVNKRWEVCVKLTTNILMRNINRDPFGRYSYGVGISHSWRRKRRAATRSKRGEWKGSVGVNRGPGGGYSVGGSVSYSWGR
ncbi:hypothetical protein RRG08_055929 [Elysia crispata]|uniref:Uncharacterized protein n=1 Tax=Elysia crispata TaxID=231223 RepID=A0AAE1DXG2_9GAST|nr:hypothetical protein RRG08_055929 [Elysia crispata]